MEGDPAIYYAAARSCLKTANDIDGYFAHTARALRAAEQAGGTDEVGRDWCGKYDPWAQGVFRMVYDSLLPALDNYAVLLNQVGFNHAIGEYNAAPAPKPAVPEQPAMAPPERAGTVDIGALITEFGSGQGLIDNIGLQVVAPDGDTDDMQNAKDAWEKLHERAQEVTIDLERLGVEFAAVDAEDAPGILEDLADLRTAVIEVFAECAVLSTFISEQHTEVTALRERKLPRVAIEQMAGAMASFEYFPSPSALELRFGASAAIGLSRDLLRASLTSAVSDFAEMRRTSYLSALPSDFRPARSATDEIKDRRAIAVDGGRDPGTASGATLREKLNDSPYITKGNITIDNGPPSGYIVKRDPSGNIINYVEFDENGRGIKRVDLTGRPHGAVPTPHVVEMVHDQAPNGRIYVRESKEVRPARPDEIP
ncbi:polymorphic toxin type 24 domain-containing protein [Nocardia asteroides]|uniref:polymorphic toxin type 24 domain-containing protein n=1 Tax=Nocardia asteroides TaxID=1824 RepID=UPI001E5566A0|nr:polymorphic toxin type 24 domain-containing protein [Nocardia asteroides]UGT63168.1 polymorphic toxin type 24 domain-containing protein [Nocardia asteroides]